MSGPQLPCRATALRAVGNGDGCITRDELSVTKAFDVLDDDDACPAMEVQGDELNSNHLDIDAMLHLINPFLVPAWGNLPRF